MSPVHLSVATLREIPIAVSRILQLMKQHPFSATDGFAVQLAATQALQLAWESRPTSAPLQVSVRVSQNAVDIELPWDDSAPARNGTGASYSAAGTAASSSSPPDRLRLIHTYMTSVFPSIAKNTLILSRLRGQGSPIAGPPAGYDFQI